MAGTSARIAVVAHRRADAKKAADVVRKRLPGTRPVAMSVADYLAARGKEPPLPLVLAASGVDREADRRFLLSARDRLLWKRPAAPVYDAISGVFTELPPRPRDRVRREARVSGGGGEPYLLLEGIVTSARASGALESSTRAWIVEHVGRVRCSERALARLARAGVRWSALRPVRLLGVVGPKGVTAGVFSSAVKVWRSS